MMSHPKLPCWTIPHAHAKKKTNIFQPYLETQGELLYRRGLLVWLDIEIPKELVSDGFFLTGNPNFHFEHLGEKELLPRRVLKDAVIFAHPGLTGD